MIEECYCCLYTLKLPYGGWRRTRGAIKPENSVPTDLGLRPAAHIVIASVNL